jgi:hypothetical protein
MIGTTGPCPLKKHYSLCGAKGIIGSDYLSFQGFVADVILIWVAAPSPTAEMMRAVCRKPLALLHGGNQDGLGKPILNQPIGALGGFFDQRSGDSLREAQLF